jgi:hypothetical protein
MKKLFGARIWARWERTGNESACVLYEYQGPHIQNGLVLHKWTPYKRSGVEIFYDTDFLLRNLSYFKPFCISTQENHACAL